jgi:protein SCO1/2
VTQNEAPSGESSRFARRAVWGMLLMAFAFVGIAGGKAIVAQSAWFSDEASAALPVHGTVPEFSLTERSGRTLSRDELRGEIWIAAFVFTRCGGVCPALSSQMARMRSRFVADGRAVRFVSFSVDPEHDTPGVLTEYAAKFGAGASDWLFLTGDRSVLQRLVGDGFRLSLLERGTAIDPNERITHSDRLVLVDRDFRIRGYYRGSDEAAMTQLVQDASSLAGES